MALFTRCKRSLSLSDSFCMCRIMTLCDVIKLQYVSWKYSSHNVLKDTEFYFLSLIYYLLLFSPLPSFSDFFGGVVVMKET